MLRYFLVKHLAKHISIEYSLTPVFDVVYMSCDSFCQQRRNTDGRVYTNSYLLKEENQPECQACQSSLAIDSVNKDLYIKLAVITRPPDGVLLAPSALAARRLRRLASLLEL